MATRAGLVEYMLPFIFLATFTTGLIFYYRDSGFIAINIVIPVIISWIAGTFASLYKYREACKLSDNTKDITNSEYQKEVEKLELSHKENLAMSEQRAREKAINENKKEIDKIRLQNAKTEESLLNQLAEEQKESKKLKAKNDTITAENTMLKKSCSTLQYEKEKLQSEIESLQTMCMKYRQDQEANKDELRKELTTLRKNHKKDMELKQYAHRAEIQRKEKEIAQNLTSDYEGRIERLKNSHKATVAKLQNELKAKMKNLESELASSRNEQCLLNEKLHSQQQQHHEFAYSSLVDAHGRQLDDRDHSSRQHQQILLTHKANMEEQKNFFQSQIEYLSKNNKLEVERLRKDHVEEQERSKTMHDQTIERLVKTHDKSIQLLKELHSSALEEKEKEKRLMLERFHLMCRNQFGRTLPFEDERLQNQKAIGYLDE